MGLSQAAFAEMMGVHRRSQINYESGKRQPTLEYLEALRSAGIDLMELMGMGEAIHSLRAAAYLHLLSKMFALLGMEGERFGFALDQALKIFIDTIKLQEVNEGEPAVDEQKLNLEMTKLAARLLHDAGIEGF